MQMAARETGFGAVEQYMHAGKLLALELLVRVLENPHHHWSALRPEVRSDCAQMRLMTRWQSINGIKCRTEQLRRSFDAAKVP